jgi:hypothetical protein
MGVSGFPGYSSSSSEQWVLQDLHLSYLRCSAHHGRHLSSVRQRVWVQVASSADSLRFDRMFLLTCLHALQLVTGQ